jgi:PAS domain S-box-containing protein
VITNDYAAPNPLKKGCPEGHVEIRRHMNVPILDGGRIVAVAGVGNKAGEYDESDVRQLTLLIQGMWRLVQRRQAEAALRESERKFRGVIEQASEGFILVDEAGRIIEYNGAAERIYEWKREKIIGMAFWDYMYMLIPEESRCGLNPDAIRRMIEEYQREGHGPAMGGCSSVNEVNCAGGSRRFTQTINFPIRTDKGHMIGNIVVDVTEQKRAEDALRESEEKFRVLTETTASAIVILQDNKVKYANPAVEKITGYSREEMLAMSPVEAASIIDPASILMLNLTRFRRRGKNENLRYEIRLKAKGGRMKWVDVTTGVISYNGSPAFLATGLDITERKQAEEKLRASLHEKEVLLKEVHHRVKNNLQVVSSMLSLQSMHLDDPADASMFRESQDRIRSMALIHEKLYQSGDLSRIDFNEYVRNLTANLLRSYGVGAGTIKLKIDVGDILLGIDQAIPCGLIVNELVSNAFKYAFPGGRRGEISVAMGRNGEKFTLVVADNGVGMPESVDYLRTKSLGLQLVNTFVEQLEGKISLDRTAGTKFAIVFREKKGRRG